MASKKVSAAVDQVVSMTFEKDGRKYFIIRRGDPVTYRIAEIDVVHRDLFYCEMEGSNGNRKGIFLNTDDVLHNIGVAAQMIDVALPMIG